MQRILIFLGVVLITMMGADTSASAAPASSPPKTTLANGVDSVTLKSSRSPTANGENGGGGRESRNAGAKRAAPARVTPLERWKTQKAAYDRYLALRAATRCTQNFCERAPVAVAPPGKRPTELADKNPVAAPVITPQQAAYVAIARLHLDTPQPVIGPSPDINEWKIAAVGYPYWLWVDGNLNPAPVSTTVLDLTVGLKAHLANVTFDMGDGTRTTCTNVTTQWSRAVTPGAASPVCGHTYTQPSLPKGKYTITAYSTWAVDWAVNGQGGTIYLYQQASTTLPVGELQVLTR